MTRDLDEVILDVTLRSGRVTSRTLLNVMREVSHRHTRAAEKAERAAEKAEHAKNEIKHGEQALDVLNRQAHTLKDVPIEDASLIEMRKRLQAYEVDFAIKQDPDDGKMHIWFKAQDENRIKKAIANVIAEHTEKKEEASLAEVIESVTKLAKDQDQSAKLPGALDKREHDLSR